MKHRALIPIESRLEGGVNRRNLKIINLSTTTSRGYRYKYKRVRKRGRKNKSQANEE
jgi:hypothetical protein